MTRIATTVAGHEIVLKEIPMPPVGAYHRSFCSCEGFRSRPCGTVEAAIDMFEKRHLAYVEEVKR